MKCTICLTYIDNGVCEECAAATIQESHITECDSRDAVIASLTRELETLREVVINGWQKRAYEAEDNEVRLGDANVKLRRTVYNQRKELHKLNQTLGWSYERFRLDRDQKTRLKVLLASANDLFERCMHAINPDSHPELLDDVGSWSIAYEADETSQLVDPDPPF